MQNQSKLIEYISLFHRILIMNLVSHIFNILSELLTTEQKQLG